MRALAWIVAVLTALWGGYWYVGSFAAEKGALAAVDALRARGDTLHYSDLSLHGFPNRFDLTVTDPAYSSATTGMGWKAPFIQSFALSYRPNEVIVVFPKSQTITGPLGDATLTTADLRASAAVAASTDLPFDRSVLVGKELALTTPLGGKFGAEELRFATDREDARPLAHRIGLEIKNLSLDPRLMAQIDPQAIMPKGLETVHVDGVVGLDAALDRHLADKTPKLTDIALTEARLIWGPTQITASGDLKVDATGIPEGRINIRTLNWRALLKVATGAGLVSEKTAPTVEKLLKTLEASSGTPDTLDLPLVFSGGRMSLGPVPLGAAPRLALP